MTLVEEYRIQFSSGREIKCNKGIIGISPEWTIYSGYDSGLYTGNESVEDKIELAQFMIQKWVDYENYLLNFYKQPKEEKE